MNEAIQAAQNDRFHLPGGPLALLLASRTPSKGVPEMLKRTGTVVAAAAVAALALPADAHATAIACGGSVSTQGITGNGCISAERWKDGHVFFRNITAHTMLTNTRAHASWVEYEAYFRVVSGGHWVKIGNGRTVVQRRSTVGPVEIGSTDRVCGPVNVKVEIRVHVRPAGGAWSNWSSAATSQCQT